MFTLLLEIASIRIYDYKKRIQKLTQEIRWYNYFLLVTIR